MKKNDISPNQLEVLRYLAEGLSSEDIAKKLGNSKKTIDAVRLYLMRKVQAKNVANLISIGFRSGWLK